jgi:F-type H+-transporting ATPase subunit b
MRRAIGIGARLLVGSLAGLLVPALALASGGGEGGGLVSLDKSLIIQMVTFLLLLALLSRVLYRPLVTKMEERTQAIKKSLEEAQQARAEAQKQREEHAAKIQAAYAEAQAIRAEALRAAGEEQRRLVEGARAEAARLVESARAEMEQDVKRARQELRREVGDLAVAVAERLIQRSLRDDDHRKIVEETLARMERVN